jgi:hypothetical protein
MVVILTEAECERALFSNTSTLKARATDKAMVYEVKGGEGFSAPSALNLIVFTNYNNAVAVRDTARRMYYANIGNSFANNREYFNWLAEEVFEKDGFTYKREWLLNMYRYFMQRELPSGFQCRNFPVSSTLAQEKQNQMSPIAEFLRDHSGVFGVHGVESQQAYEKFKIFCSMMGRKCS